MGGFKKLGELYNAEVINNMGYSGNEDCYVIGTNNEVIHPGASPLLKPIVILDNNDTGKAEHYLVQYMNENLINLKPINEDGSFGEGSHSYDYDGFVKKFGQGSISAHQNIVIDPTINLPSADELMGTTQEPLTFQSTIEKHGIDEVTKYEVGNKILYTNNNTGALVNPTLDRVMEVKDGNGERHIILISSISENSIKFAELPGDYGEEFLYLSKTSKDDEISYLLTSGLASSDLIGATLLGFGNNFEIKEMSADEFLTTYQFENYSDNSDNEEIIIPEEIEADLAPTEEGEDKPPIGVGSILDFSKEYMQASALGGYQLSEYRELTIEEISSNYSINRILNDRNPENYEEQVLYVPLIDVSYTSLLTQLIDNYELYRDNVNKLSANIIQTVKNTGKPFDNETYNNKISNIETIVNDYYKNVTKRSEDEVKSIIKQYNTALVEIKEGVKLSLLLKRVRELNGKVIPGTKEYKQNDLPADAPFILSDTKKDFYKIKCYQDYSVKIYSFVEKNTSNEMEYLFEIANIPLPYHKDKIQLT